MTFRQIVQYLLHPRRWGRAMVSAFFALVGAMALMFGALLFVLPGKTLALPDWVMLRVEQALVENLPEFELGYDTAAVQISEDWSPTIVLQNLSLVSREDGRSAARVGDVNFHVVLGALLFGRAEISQVNIDGVFISARRNLSGAIDLGLGSLEGSQNTQFNFEDVQQFLHESFASEQFARLAGIDVQNVSIEYQDARADQVWVIDGGVISLSKTNDDALALRGDFVLLGNRSYASSFVANITSQNGDAPLEFGFQMSDVPAQDLASQAAALAWLSPVNAPISGALRGAYENGAVRGLNATLQIGHGVLQPNAQTRPIPFDKAHTYFTYDAALKTFVFSDIQVQAKNLTVSAEGLAQLDWPQEAPFPTGMITQLRMENFVLDAQELTPKPVALNKAHADFRMRFDPFEVELGEFLASLNEIKDPVKASGWAKSDNAGWAVQLNGSLAALDLAEVKSRWPSAVKPKTLNWISENIHQAQAKDLQFGVLLKPQQEPQTFLSFLFDQTIVTPLKDMPPVRNGQGVFELYQNQLAILVEQGEIGVENKGVVDVSGTTFVIPDVREKGGLGIADIAVTSDIPALMAILETGKIKILSRIKQPFDFMKGTAQGRALVEFPRRKGVKFEEISLIAKADLKNAKTSAYGAAVLDIPKGKLTLEDKQLRIGGAGTWNGIAFDGAFETKLEQNSEISISARPIIDETAVRKFVPGLAKGLVSGKTRGDLVISLGAGRAPRFKMTSDVRGLSLSVAALALKKPAKEGAKFSISGPLASSKVAYDIGLKARSVDLKGKISLEKSQKLSLISLDALRLGNWFKGALTMTPVRNGMFDIAVSKGNADFRNFPASLGSSPQKTNSGFIRNLSARLDRLIVSEGIALTGINGDFAMAGGVKGPFTARLNGKAPLNGQIKRFKTGSGVEIRSSDAGGVLAAGDLMKKARGGDLFLSMTPTGKSGTFDGALNVKNVRMLDAPAMVELLNALSIIGLLNQLNEKGLLLQEVDARFRLTPTQVILRRSSAFGPALGMSLDGYYTLGSGVMDMQGVLSPLFIVNGIGSPLTRKGEGLLGFSFILKGTSGKPKVKVNPLSIFTPGMFREIFRRPPPKYESDQ